MADEPTEEDRQAYKTALRSSNGHKLQIGRVSKTIEDCIINNRIEDRDLVETSLKLFETQISKIETILDNEAGNPACPQDFLIDLTNFVIHHATMATKVKKLLKAGDQPVGEQKSPITLDTSGIGDAISASLNALNLKSPISNSDLPKFYGDPSEYVPFSECFDYLVHNDDSIPDALKAQYLKKCLPESPAA